MPKGMFNPADNLKLAHLRVYCKDDKVLPLYVVFDSYYLSSEKQIGLKLLSSVFSSIHHVFSRSRRCKAV